MSEKTRPLNEVLDELHDALETSADLDEGSRVAVRSALEGWYRREAAGHLPQRLGELAGKLGVTPGRISIRSQKTRWGSCSDRGTISLNWRLMLVSSELVDYILVHELCHLRHMDHSAKFWELVGGLIPDYPLRRGVPRSHGERTPAKAV